MCISPFINKLISGLDRKSFLVFVLVQILIFSLLDTATMSIFNVGTQGGYFVQFLMFYTIGAYLGKYKEACVLKGKNNSIFCLILGAILIASAVAFDIVETKIPVFDDRSGHFYQRNSIIVVLLATSILALFSSMKSFSNKFINIISNCTFGIYLIHDNSYMRDLLWNNWFNNVNYANSKWLIVHFVASVLIVFVSCIVIEYIRKYFIEKYLLSKPNKMIVSAANNLINNISNRIDYFMNRG